MEKGEVIAAVTNRFTLLRNVSQYKNIEKTPIIYSPVNLYFATTKGKNAHVRDTIDEYITAAHAQPVSFFYKAMDKWFQTAIAVDFSLPRWIVVSLYVSGFVVISLIATALLLKSQVARKTSELKQKNIELDKAKHNVEAEYQTLVENSPDMITRFDKQFKHIYASPSVKKAVDIPAESFVSKSLRELGFPEEQAEHWETQIKKAFDEKKISNTQFDFDGKNGRTTFDWRLIPELDSDGNIKTVLSIARDITEHKKAEGQIQRDLKEKETLLRELYHRTKNNMQVISSLLTLQSSYIKDEKVLKYFQDVQNRIYSMSLVHQKLYQSQDLSNIELVSYIEDLTKTLVSSYQDNAKRVQVKLDLERVKLPIEAAIPCGLLINEVITNSLKYAFPGDRAGEIGVVLHAGQNDEVDLWISDDGVGLPNDIDTSNPKTLGLQLIKDLAEYQLDGKVVLNRESGTEFHITFRNEIE